MDNYSSYQQQLSVVASEASNAASVVASEKAAVLKTTEADRFKSQVIEGVTTPLGVDLLEGSTKDVVSKVAPQLIKNVIGDEAAKGFSQGGITKTITGAIGRKARAVMADNEIPLPRTPVTTPVTTPVATSGEATDAVGSAVGKLPVVGESVDRLAPESEQLRQNLTDDVGKATERAAKLGDAVDDSLASATAESTAEDWNPIGIGITAVLGLSTLLAGAFGHRDKEPRHPITAPPVTNASTQFGT